MRIGRDTKPKATVHPKSGNTRAVRDTIRQKHAPIKSPTTNDRTRDVFESLRNVLTRLLPPGARRVGGRGDDQGVGNQRPRTDVLRQTMGPELRRNADEFETRALRARGSDHRKHPVGGNIRTRPDKLGSTT